MKKKTISMILAMLILVSAVFVLSGCEGNQQESDAPTGNNREQLTSEEQPPIAQTLTIAEFDELLAQQELHIFDVETVIFRQYSNGERYVATWKAKNNSDVDIRNFTIGIMAWCEDGLPAQMWPLTGRRDFHTFSFNDVNILPGEVFDGNLENTKRFQASSALGYAEECSFAQTNGAKPIKEIRVIAMSYTGYEGESWSNPYADAFRNALAGRKYDADRLIDITPPERP